MINKPTLYLEKALPRTSTDISGISVKKKFAAASQVSCLSKDIYFKMIHKTEEGSRQAETMFGEKYSAINHFKNLTS